MISVTFRDSQNKLSETLSSLHDNLKLINSSGDIFDENLCNRYIDKIASASRRLNSVSLLLQNIQVSKNQLVF